MKKLISIAAAAAIVLPALPAVAANPTSNVTVKWNITATGTLAVNTNYSATGAQQTTAPSILAAVGTGTGSCTAAGAGSEAAGTVNFGSIAPDSGAVTTGCQYKNAANAVITTNDSNGWSLTEALQSALSAGYSLCASPNGFTWGAAGGATLAATQSSASTAVAPSGTACGTGMNNISTTAATALTDPNPFSAASAANAGEDLELLVPPLASVGAKTATLVYTLVLN